MLCNDEIVLFNVPNENSRQWTTNFAFWNLSIILPLFRWNQTHQTKPNQTDDYEDDNYDSTNLDLMVRDVAFMNTPNVTESN